MEQPEPLYIQPDDFMKRMNHKKQMRKKIRLVIILGILAVAIVVTSFLYVPKRFRINIDPRERDLNALTTSSQPVTATPEERGGGLNKLNADSTEVKTNTDSRLQALEALSNNK